MTAFALVVPFADLARVVDELREETCLTKPSHGMPPHVTLLVPSPGAAGAIAEVLGRVLGEAARLMRASVDGGREERAVYRRAGRPCPRCGEPIRSRGQGDDNRTAYWCPRCQRGEGPRGA